MMPMAAFLGLPFQRDPEDDLARAYEFPAQRCQFPGRTSWSNASALYATRSRSVGFLRLWRELRGDARISELGTSASETRRLAIACLLGDEKWPVPDAWRVEYRPENTRRLAAEPARSLGPWPLFMGGKAGARTGAAALSGISPILARSALNFSLTIG